MNDEQLRKAIDGIFLKYDTDRSGTLEATQVFHIISDTFKSLGKKQAVTSNEIREFIVAIDKNGDGKIDKPELYSVLKELISSS